MTPQAVSATSAPASPTWKRAVTGRNTLALPASEANVVVDPFRAKLKIVIVSADGGIAWNPFQKNLTANRGWLFSTPATPRAIAHGIAASKSPDPTRTVVVVHSKHVESKDALGEIVGEIVDVGGVPRHSIAAIISPDAIEAAAVSVAFAESLFPENPAPSTTECRRQFEVIAVPSPDTNVKNSEIQGFLESPVVAEAGFSAHSNPFATRLSFAIASLVGVDFARETFDVVSAKGASVNAVFKDIADAAESATTAVAATPHGVIILTGAPGEDLFLSAKILAEKSAIPARIVSAKEFIRIRGGFAADRARAIFELSTGTRLIIASPNPKTSDRIAGARLAKEGETTAVVAWVTKPAFGVPDTLPPQHPSAVKASAALFEPPNEYSDKTQVMRVC